MDSDNDNVRQGQFTAELTIPTMKRNVG